VAVGADVRVLPEEFYGLEVMTRIQKRTVDRKVPEFLSHCSLRGEQ
jgi:hypothetical protein